MKRTRIKRTRGEQVVFSIMFVILVLYTLTFIYAYVITLINTLKDPTEYALGNSFGLPEGKWYWSNYLEVFDLLVVNGTGYFGMIFNSIWETLLGTTLPIIATVMSSYAYARYKFFGRKAVYMVAIILLTISLPGSLPATYKLYGDLGLLNSPLFYVGATAGLSSTFIVMCGFWNSVSWEYGEAAFVDGANDVTVFFRIMVPQALPLVGIMFLLGFMGGWTDANTSMLYLPEYPSVAYGLYEYEASTKRNMNYPVYFAGLVLTAIPSVILYAIFQDKIMTSMNIGGLKG
mgnify:CR=1 FL=1